MINNILFLFPPSNVNSGLYEDLKKDKRVFLRCSSLRNIKSGILSFIRKVHLSEKVNSFVNLPLKDIWYDYHDISDLLPKIEYILVVDLALNSKWILETLIKCRKKNPNIKIGLFFINALDTNSHGIRSELKKPLFSLYNFKWDDLYTFDKGDANKYKMKYIGFNYYSMRVIENNKHPENDLYSIAIATEDRKDLYFHIYEYLSKNGCKCDFHLKVKGKERPNIQGIDFLEKYYPYDEVVKVLQNSKCILEILRPGQNGPSLRYFEAVCYNKKLLTNNKEIVNFPYYDERYMKIFTTLEDIDVNWLKNDVETIDYHYKGDFSPTKLIDYIIGSH